MPLADSMATGDDAYVQTTPLGNKQYAGEVQMHVYNTVADQYMGTSSDRHDMMILGRSQVLRVRHTSLNFRKRDAG